MWHATIKVWVGVFTVLSIACALTFSVVGFAICVAGIVTNLSVLYLTNDSSAN